LHRSSEVEQQTDIQVVIAVAKGSLPRTLSPDAADAFSGLGWPLSTEASRPLDSNGLPGTFAASRQGDSLKTTVRTEGAAWIDAGSGISWASIAAGAIVAAALSRSLFALGAGLGLSSVSPWADSGVSASTFKNAAGVCDGTWNEGTLVPRSL
jgi:hypothetical protein